MHYNDLVGGFRLLGAVLVELLGGVGFSVSGFEMDLEVELTLVLVSVNGIFFLGGGEGGRGAERAY